MVDPISVISGVAGAGSALSELAKGGVKRNRCCCSAGNEYVQKTGGTLTLSSVACCVFGERRRKEGKEELLALFTKKYGEYVVQQELAHAGLTNQLAFTKEDLFRLAAFFGEDLDAAKSIVKAGQYFAAFKNLESRQEFSHLMGPSSITARFDPARFSIKKGKDVVQDFSVKKIRTGIEKATFDRPLKAEEVTDIVNCILSEIVFRFPPEQLHVELQSKEIREIALAVIHQKGLHIQRPDSFQILPESIAQKLEKLDHDSDLKDEERTLIMEAYLKWKHTQIANASDKKDSEVVETTV